jgi:hypothetical protein
LRPTIGTYHLRKRQASRVSIKVANENVIPLFVIASALQFSAQVQKILISGQPFDGPLVEPSNATAFGTSAA